MPDDYNNTRKQEEQFTQLFREYAPRIFYYFNKQVRRKDIAEDLVQEVFTNVWKRKDSLFVQETMRPDMGAYLFVATRNHLYNYLQKLVKEKKLLAIPDDEEPEISSYTHIEEYVSEKQQKELYNAILDTLSPQRQQAFRLSREHHLTYQEIADQMGIAPRTVEKHISAALQTLRSRMGEFIITIYLFIIW